MKHFLFWTILLASRGVMAASEGAGGSPMDLIPAFINLAILVSILGFILKNPIRKYYSERSDSVKNLMERASSKAKEADMMMEAQRKKLDGVATEIDKLVKESEENIVKYKQEYAAEVDERIVKMKEDAAVKIEAEKAEQLNKLNSNFLDEVIDKAKTIIKANPELANQATDKVLEGLRK